jgi:hypothetical protein
MNKIGLILAGAVVFDLGLVVTSSQAAYDAFLKIDSTQPHAALKIKLTKVEDVTLCTNHGGTVSRAGADQYCLVPAVTQAHQTGPAHTGY